MSPYPPYKLGPGIHRLLIDIGEALGRLWQSLVLREWKPRLAYLPVETVIRSRQRAYYQALADAGNQGQAGVFIEFMLKSLFAAIQELGENDQVSDQVARLLQILTEGERSSADLMKLLALVHRPNFRKNYLNPALKEAHIERTQPDSPRSPSQRYRLSDKGRTWLKKQKFKI